MGISEYISIWLVAYLPLWKIWKSVGICWDDYSQDMEKKMFQATNQLCRYSYMHVILHFQCFISIFIYQVWTISSLTGGSIKIKTATVVNHWYSGKKERTTDNRSNYFDGVLLFYPFRAFLCIFIRIVWICEPLRYIQFHLQHMIHTFMYV